MAKLNQIVAVVGGVKSRAQATVSQIYQKLQKTELLQGITKTYEPDSEEGEKLPSESKRVQSVKRIPSAPSSLRDHQPPVAGYAAGAFLFQEG